MEYNLKIYGDDKGVELLNGKPYWTISEDPWEAFKSKFLFRDGLVKDVTWGSDKDVPHFAFWSKKEAENALSRYLGNKTDCTCEIFILVNTGCKCGAFKKEIECLN